MDVSRRAMNPFNVFAAVIRAATPADAAALAACNHACWREVYLRHVSPGFLAALDDGLRAEWWRQVLSKSGSEQVIIAEIFDQIVGFASSGRSNDDPPTRDTELHLLYVREALYGTGLGQRLFDAAVGTRPCSLWVAEDNNRAVAFYRRQGFEPDGASMLIQEFEGLVAIRMLR